MAYRVKGSLPALRERAVARIQADADYVAKGLAASAATPPGTRQEQRSKRSTGAIRVTVTERTLGASTRKGHRLTVPVTEYPEGTYQVGQASQYGHTAEWVANPLPMAYVTATKCDAIGRETIAPKHNATAVEFEWRLDHYNRGQRKN